MKKLLLILAVTLGLVGNQAAAIKISEYEKFAETNKEAADLYIMGILQGISYAISFVNTFNRDSPDYIELSCIPDGVSLGRNLAKAALKTYKEAKKGKDEDVHHAVFGGLIMMFPCN